MSIREQIEKDEDARLAPYAALAARSMGRLAPEPEHAYRTAFQRDRDRVLHSTAFRRLQYKTQVFVYHEGDHFRSRLTHTLEVAQIARTVARALRTNEDLVEAIVLAHDLGHTPFGHSGERAMHQLLEPHGGFEHNRQSLRVVDWLEVRDPSRRGLNLTAETRAGILKHGADYPRYPHPVALPELGAQASVEAQIANLADSIAYNAHDVDDGLRSGLLTFAQLDRVRLWVDARARAGARTSGAEVSGRGPVLVELIDALVTDMIESTRARLADLDVRTPEDVATCGERCVALSDGVAERLAELAGLLRRDLYQHEQVLQMGARGQAILRDLFGAYLEDPSFHPGGDPSGAAAEPKERVIADYLACMTDRFAMSEHARIVGGAPAPGIVGSDGWR